MSMICTPDSSHAARLRRPVAGWTKAMGLVFHVLLWPVRVARARRELARLAHFSEYELRDIGLSGQDLRNATALPLDVDPTDFLARRAAESARGIGRAVICCERVFSLEIGDG